MSLLEQLIKHQIQQWDDVCELISLTYNNLLIGALWNKLEWTE